MIVPNTKVDENNGRWGKMECIKLGEELNLSEIQG